MDVNSEGVEMRVVFVHGACVKDGDWWWHLTAAQLEEAGVSSETPRLPSCGETGDAIGLDGAGFAEDVAAVREVLLGSEEPAVVVGHSYGGMVVTEAAAGVAAVRSLVYVSSYLAAPGESMAEVTGGGAAPFLLLDLEAGTFAVDPDQLVETFLHDCPSSVAAQGADHLAAQTLSVTQQPVGAAAWQEKPSTYVVCSADRGTPPAAQREFAARAERVVELDTGHHPFLADPQGFADLLVEVAAGPQ